MNSVKLFLCGDVMTGRGIDQILPHPVLPDIYESYITDAREYIKLAQRKNGPIPYPVNYSYIWGDALDELESRKPNIRIVNLETSITKKNEYWRGKGINYRMSPDNIQCLEAVLVDCCVLSNNHVLDWGYDGLNDTILALEQSGITHAGAGHNLSGAYKPAVLSLSDDYRTLVFSFGDLTCGIPQEWTAAENKPGVWLLDDLSEKTIRHIREKINTFRRGKEIVVASIHWGDNWGYEISDNQITFAHMLVDCCGVSIVYGHSSHHTKRIEMYKNKIILYGCGDFVNDYEGIGGYEDFRGDIAMMYFVDIDSHSGHVRCQLVPMQIRNFRLKRAPPEDIEWLKDLYNQKTMAVGAGIEWNDAFYFNVKPFG